MQYNQGKTAVAVGTPNRVEKLMESNCLNPESVILDFNFRNAKRQRMIDEKLTKSQLASFLSKFAQDNRFEKTKLLVY